MLISFKSKTVDRAQVDDVDIGVFSCGICGEWRR
jgi:hypothetical protein